MRSARRAAEAAIVGVMSGRMGDYTQQRASFLDGYLVAADSSGAPIVGAVRRTGSVWRIMQFGLSADEQPGEVFASREDAGQRLLQLAAAPTPSGQQAAPRQPRVVRPAPSRP